ncbi:MAG: hypothetical protein QNJ53_05550 [Pleurocapsa sp. MO_192.B19]|nr:hypothetical protein [Pleurocapsa sp. MO_192.B19]
MQTTTLTTLTQTVRCPNCGSAAIRHYYDCRDELISCSHLGEQLIHTECPACDYLMKMRSIDGSVIEAYAPSIHPVHFKR